MSTMTQGCLISLPGAAIFTTTKTSLLNPSLLTVSSKPIKPHRFSCSLKLHSPSSFPLFTTKFKNTNFPSLLAFVAEDYNTAVLEEETTSEWENHNQYSDGAPEEEAQLWEGEEEVEDDARELQGYEKYSKPPSEDAKLYVGNLHYDIDSQTLGDLFLQAGGVEHAEVKYDRGTNQSRGFGFVIMSSVQEAENAVETFHKYELNGRLLTVNTASPRGTRPEPVSEAANRIYVGNLPWDVNDARLEQVFSAHGKVLNARVVLDRVTSRSQGFGFVTMSTESELNDAIANLDGQSLNGRAIRVSVANERPRLY